MATSSSVPSTKPAPVAFDVVFLPGLAEGLFPRRASEDPLLLDEHRIKLQHHLETQDQRIAQRAHAAAFRRRGRRRNAWLSPTRAWTSCNPVRACRRSTRSKFCARRKAGSLLFANSKSAPQLALQPGWTGRRPPIPLSPSTMPSTISHHCRPRSNSRAIPPRAARDI